MSSGERVLKLPHGHLRLPAFLPDATRGVVRAADATDLLNCRVQAVQMNVFHLMQHPGSSTIRALGGLHRMFAWDRPIVTDSGGFQAYSLIRQDSRYGYLSEKGLTFKPDRSRRKFNLSPEKSVQLQLGYGADLVICLDDCTHVDDPIETQRESVERTIGWARRGKAAFQRFLDEKGTPEAERPLLFAVIQGGGSRELRKRCADALLEIGFSGYGYGGWPLDGEGHLLTDVIGYTRELVPPEFPMHALGVGHPENVVECVRIGYDLADSTMPTRDARHGRLYAFASGADPLSGPLQGEWLSFVYIRDSKHIKSAAPVSPICDCLCCSSYSAGYLHHLFDINDSLYMRLATLHNVRFMTQLTECLGAHSNE